MDQETAIEELRERYAHGGLQLDEFRQLMGTLMVTTDPNECQAIIDQLPPEPQRDRSVSVLTRSTTSSSTQAHHISAFFGEVDRSAQLWELGPETVVNATFGEVKLDVRMARLSEGENILRLNALFGEVKAVIPRGMRVFVETQVRFGEVKVPQHSAVSGITMSDSFSFGSGESESYLRIIATATFGEVKIVAQ